MIGPLFLLLLAICMVAGIVLMIRGFVMFKDSSKSRMQFLISNLIFLLPRETIIITFLWGLYVYGLGLISIIIGIFEFLLLLFFAFKLIGKTASPSIRNLSMCFSIFFLLCLIISTFFLSLSEMPPNSSTSVFNCFQYNYFDGYTYKVDNGEITIVKYSPFKNDFEKDIVIPSVIEGKPVTQIDAFAFHENSQLTSVTIPGSVRSIGDGAFSESWSLQTVTISEGVTSLGSGVFEDSKSLTHVTLPASLTSIDENPFSYCSQLTEINVSPENSEFSTVDGILYTKNLDKIIAYPGGREGDFIIPDSVEDLGIDAFGGCYDLTGVTISSNVRTIGERAFFGCSSLQEIVIPEGVTSIGDDAFYNRGTLVIHCNEGSYAEAYAEENKIEYELIEE